MSRSPSPEQVEACEAEAIDLLTSYLGRTSYAQSIRSVATRLATLKAENERLREALHMLYYGGDVAETARKVLEALA